MSDAAAARTRAVRTGPGALGAAAAVTAALALAGCGSAGHAPRPGSGATAPANTVPAGAPGTLRIAPARPTTRSDVAFAFTAPVADGIRGRSEIQYSLSVTGPPGPRCVAAHEAAAPHVAAHAAARVSLGPAGLGGPWCPGRWSARVIELQRAHCSPGTPCPQYIRVVAIVARGVFSVAGGEPRRGSSRTPGGSG